MKSNQNKSERISHRSVTLCTMFASRLALTAAAAGRALSQGERVIFDKLTAALAPGKLTVDDVSGTMFSDNCGSLLTMTCRRLRGHVPRHRALRPVRGQVKGPAAQACE